MAFPECVFILTHCLVHSSMQQSLTVLVPRVWPFLRHTISSVRRAALETLFTLLSKADEVNLREQLDIHTICGKVLVNIYTYRI